MKYQEYLYYGPQVPPHWTKNWDGQMRPVREGVAHPGAAEGNQEEKQIAMMLFPASHDGRAEIRRMAFSALKLIDKNRC